MRTHHVIPSAFRFIFIASLACVLLVNGCTFSLVNIPGLTQTPAPTTFPSGPTSTPQPAAAITFTVALPTPLLEGEVLYLSVVDEVTGLGLNPANYPMQGMDSLDYTITIPFALNSVVKYRYMRQGKLPTLEDTSADKAVRYRMYIVSGPGEVEDVISAWGDKTFDSPHGRITGQIEESGSQAPLPNILVAAGGQQTLTDSNGKFSLENLPAGTHNLVAYAMDGAYQAFQQGARVEAGKTTQVSLSLTPASMVQVVFTVSVPGSSFENLPIRMAGNLSQLGDTFGDLQGGLNTLAARMPVLSPLPDGRYTLSLSLPGGADIRYKYTLGDGFWNAEHESDGTFALRQLIVPAAAGPIQVQDNVKTWLAGTASPILFEVTAPQGTPAGDTVSIQFNPYGWTEPIPMWMRANNQWIYELYSPLNMLGDFEYRYCRNDQCGVADDVSTTNSRGGWPVSATLAPQDLQDTITTWNWFQPGGPVKLVGLAVTQRKAGFWTGMEFLPSPDPTWQVWTPQAIQDIKSRSANWLVLAPTWSVSRTDPFVFSPLPGVDAAWSDQIDSVTHARGSDLDTALFPMVNLPSDEATWWQSAPRDATWWEAWFDRYAAFAAYHADLATKAGAKALILGGDWVAPALPGGEVNGNNSGVPANAEARWKSLLADVRRRFAGQVLWAVSYPGGLKSMPSFASDLDGIYLLWSAPLTGSRVEELQASAGKLLDKDIQPIQAVLNKPVILAVAYPSANGAASEPLPIQELFQPGTTQAKVNLQAQEDVYQALLMAVNERDWLGGFISRGYYPPAALQDASASVHGKPAENDLWYWFGRFLGTAQ